jgi:hypothetical protein
MALQEDERKCLDELTYYVKSMVETVEEKSDLKKWVSGDDYEKIVDQHLFSLGCYMRRDDKTYTGYKNAGHTNSAVTNAILKGVREIRKKLQKHPAPLTKKLDKKIDWWLGKHNVSQKRYFAVSSKTCGDKAKKNKNLTEKMPVYMETPKFAKLKY